MSEGKHVDQPEIEADTLIGRIVDREATSGDCEAFEHMASVEPILWRALALRHLDMAMLSDRVGEHTDAAERVARAIARLAGIEPETRKTAARRRAGPGTR